MSIQATYELFSAKTSVTFQSDKKKQDEHKMHFFTVKPARIISGAAKTFLSLIQRLPAALLFSPKQITHITDFLCCTTIYVDTFLIYSIRPK